MSLIREEILRRLDPDQIREATEADDGIGFCVRCGAETGGVEPDARRYTCEQCGEKTVYGAEELMLMIGEW